MRLEAMNEMNETFNERYTYNHPLIHKEGFFSLNKYLKISNLVWIGKRHLRMALTCLWT